MKITHYDNVIKAIGSINSYETDLIAEHISQVQTRVLTCGNGGSAATAIHFASDLRSVGINAWDLLSPSKVTQIMNDVGPENIFYQQVRIDDVVIAFTGSGLSPNIIGLLSSPAYIYIVTGTMNIGKRPWDNYVYPRLSVLEVESDDYEVIEDVHLIICHAIKKRILERQQFNGS